LRLASSLILGGFSTREIQNVRPEIISVTFFKSKQDDSSGFTLCGNEARIAAFTEASMASYSSLRPGDKILSVNTKDCASEQMDSISVSRMLQSAVGDVTVVVHNQGGMPDLVSSTIVKRPDDGFGLCLGSINNSIVITSIRPDSKFANSVLNVGDVVLEINQTPCGHLSLLKALNIFAKTLRESHCWPGEARTRESYCHNFRTTMFWMDQS
jgi:C-terminal processing protease CtpA/Prc